MEKFIGDAVMAVFGIPDAIATQGETRMELARALAAADRRGEAAAEARQALDLFEAKGDQLNAAKARAMLDDREP